MSPLNGADRDEVPAEGDASDTVRVGLVEWPDELTPSQAARAFESQLNAAALDLLVLNELPFGPWLAATDRFEKAAAARSIAQHEEGLAWLAGLNVGAIVTSRPVWSADRLGNEAVLIDQGRLRTLHQKGFLPEEAGWYEASWYSRGDGPHGFASVGGAAISVLLCTELMFNEHARRAGRAGAQIIVVPRATAGVGMWQAAARMAAIVSGAYVVSSNRTGNGFAGTGFAVDPNGEMIGSTSSSDWLCVAEFDLRSADSRKSEYPCYVSE